MSDRSTFDAFEQRVASELERYVAAATDPKPAAEIAAAAMQPRSLGARARSISSRRRLLLLGLAAVLLIPAALIGSGSIRPAPALPGPVQPQRSPESRSVASPSARATAAFTAGAAAIIVRRANVPDPGVSIYAIQRDGSEALVRHVPDSIVAGSKLSEWGAAASSGWLALSVEHQGGPWPMVLIDLRDDGATPWVVNEAGTGAIGPRWGPTGLVAADAGGNGESVVIADPETHQTRIISTGGLVGGGPSIVWTSDPVGIVGASGTATYRTVPIDGSEPQAGVGRVFDPRGAFGNGLAGLRICTPDAGCPGPADGRIERVEADGTARTIWRPSTPDRVLSMAFGAGDDEYWLSLDHANGRQVTLVHLRSGQTDVVATVNRLGSWQTVGAPEAAPDGSSIVLFLDIGSKAAAAVVPLDGGSPTFHTGMFVGFVDRAALALAALGSPTPGTTLPPIGERFLLPSLDQLIAAELAINPGERVLGKESHDAVDGDTVTRTVTVPTIMPNGSVYLDCSGPASVTVTTGGGSTTNPCLSAGSYVIDTGASAPITVTARGDTSWRVVVYVQGPVAPGATEPPTASAP